MGWASHFRDEGPAGIFERWRCPRELFCRSVSRLVAPELSIVVATDRELALSLAWATGSTTGQDSLSNVLRLGADSVLLGGSSQPLARVALAVDLDDSAIYLDR